MLYTRPSFILVVLALLLIIYSVIYMVVNRDSMDQQTKLNWMYLMLLTIIALSVGALASFQQEAVLFLGGAMDQKNDLMSNLSNFMPRGNANFTR